MILSKAQASKYFRTVRNDFRTGNVQVSVLSPATIMSSDMKRLHLLRATHEQQQYEMQTM